MGEAACARGRGLGSLAAHTWRCAHITIIVAIETWLLIATTPPTSQFCPPQSGFVEIPPDLQQILEEAARSRRPSAPRSAGR